MSIVSFGGGSGGALSRVGSAAAGILARRVVDGLADGAYSAVRRGVDQLSTTASDLLTHLNSRPRYHSSSVSALGAPPIQASDAMARSRFRPRRGFRRFKRRTSYRRRRTFRRRRSTRFRSRRVFRRRRFTKRKSFRRRIPSTFRRRQKKPRRNMRGSMMNLGRKMVVGQSLPFIGFGRCRYSGVYQFPMTGTNTNLCNTSTWQVNQVGGSFMSGVGEFNYSSIYKLLYKEYLVLGTKIKINLQPSLIRTLTSSTQKLNDQGSGEPGTTIWPGYWYLRVYYPGLSAITDPDSRMGVPISMTVPDNSNSDLAARWKREIDFLNDRSVIYTRDMRSWYYGLHESAVGTTFNSLSRELGVHVKARGPSLIYKFSAKKMYRQKNLLAGHFARTDANFNAANPFWAEWNQSPLVPVFIRFGYVRFDYSVNGPESQTLHWVPPVLNDYRAQVEIDYALALRVPTNTDDLRDAEVTADLMSKRALAEKAEVERKRSFEPVPEEPDAPLLKRVHFSDFQDEFDCTADYCGSQEAGLQG